MNPELTELIRLYEAMHTCMGDEPARTNATKALEAAVLQSAVSHRLSFSEVMRFVKEHYHERARAEERRKKLPPPPAT